MSIPTVVIVGADKGGVGKTTLTRTLLDFFKANGVEYRAFDTETPEGVLKRFFPAKTTVVDLTKSDGQMTIFDTLSKNVVTVIDVRAGLLTPTLEVLGAIGFLDAVREGKLKIVVLHVLGSTVASFEEIGRTAAVLLGSQHFLVTNHINDTTFYGQDISAVGVNGVIDIPKLNELAMEHVEQAGVPFTDFVADIDTNSMVLRGYVRNWLGKVFGQLQLLKLVD